MSTNPKEGRSMEVEHRELLLSVQVSTKTPVQNLHQQHLQTGHLKASLSIHLAMSTLHPTPILLSLCIQCFLRANAALYRTSSGACVRDSEAAASVNSKVVISLLLLTITSVREGKQGSRCVEQSWMERKSFILQTMWLLLCVEIKPVGALVKHPDTLKRSNVFPSLCAESALVVSLQAAGGREEDGGEALFGAH